MKRIHIIGSGPRTGTTLLAEVMSVCLNIDQTVAHEARIYKDEPLVGNIFLTKYPSDYYAINLPLKLNPNLYVVCIIRDPRDAIVSKHGSKPNTYWAGLRYWKLFVPYWNKLSKHSRFITINYEEFVSNPDGIQNYLLKKIPFLKDNEKFSNYHKIALPNAKAINALKGVRPIKPVGIGSWKNDTSRILGQVTLHGDISDDLIKFGYEKNKNWLSFLNNVKPDFTPSHWPEYFTKKDLRKRKFGEKREVVNILLRRIGINPTKLKIVLKRVLNK